MATKKRTVGGNGRLPPDGQSLSRSQQQPMTMGLKCSVIGHKYGEASVERDREEQGSEVVITIREEETCERCGNTRVVSENKEVTSIETPSDIAGEMVEGDGPDAMVGGADSSGEAETVADTAVETEREAVDPGADDAEILDAEADAGGDSELDDPSTVESAADTDDAIRTNPDEDDGIIIDGDDESADGDGREPGAWPEEPDSGDDDWTPITETEKEGPDDTDAESATDVEPLGGSAVTVPEGKFRCPECGFSTDVESSSLRAGDFCPECHKGALITTVE